MRDFDGNQLKVGQRVAVQSRHYKELEAHYVIGFTRQKVKVSRLHPQSMKAEAESRHVDPYRVSLLPIQL